MIFPAFNGNGKRAIKRKLLHTHKHTPTNEKMKENIKKNTHKIHCLSTLCDVTMFNEQQANKNQCANDLKSKTIV